MQQRLASLIAWVGARRGLALLGLAGFGVLSVRSAWLADDAYISFRVIDNLLTGYGLRYNVAERVRAFTHPLWLGVLAAVTSVTREFYYSPLVLNLAASIGAVALVLFRVAATRAGACLAVVLLAGSKAFVDYSTSGFEDALTFFLLALFFALRAPPRPTPRRAALLGLVLGLAVVNRLDTVLLAGPLLVALLVEVGPRARGRVVVSALAPLAIWETASFLYYGALLPNTALAKLATGLPPAALVPQGLTFLRESFNRDPVTLGTIVTVAWASLLGQVPKAPAVLAGIGIHLAYVVWIGGHFMSGRFLAAPLLLAAIVVARTPSASAGTAWALGALALAVSALSPCSPLRSGPGYGFTDAPRPLVRKVWRGIVDERAIYYKNTGLLHAIAGAQVPSGVFVLRVQQDRRRAEREGVLVREKTAIGFYGFFAGPRVHILDSTALVDPLLARFRVAPGSAWRVGHFFRAVPDGYLEALESGENRIRDPDLAAYYERLRVVTRGPLGDPRRWAQAARLVLGMDDHLLRGYEARGRAPGPGGAAPGP